MMLLTSLAATGLLAAFALADGAAIVDAITTIQANTAQLNTTIVQWQDALAGFNRIQQQSNVTLASINDGTAVAEASDPLTFDEGLALAGATFPLIDDLNVTLINFIAAQPKFAALCKLQVALNALKAQRAASNDFSAAVVEKVPSDLTEAAQLVVEPIDQYFAVAVANYTAAVQQNKKANWKGWNGAWGPKKYGAGKCKKPAKPPVKPPGYGYHY